MRLPYVVSEILASVAETEAAKIAVPMAIAIVDGEGGLQLFKRMDGTLPVSTELAVSKAYTAAILRMPTDQVGEMAQPGHALYGIQHTHNGKIVLFGGGYPLCIQSEVVAGIGVSGGTVEQDMQVAKPAVQMLEFIECWAKEIKPLVPHANGNGWHAAMPAVKDKLWHAFAGLTPQVPEGTIAALTGGVLLALS
jgi:uncharacterized protein GlcG (DUF336 family)